MREKVFLVIHLFKIPFKFQLEVLNTVSRTLMMDENKLEDKQSFIIDDIRPGSIFINDSSRLQNRTFDELNKSKTVPIKIEDVSISSNIDYINEHGNVTSKQSRNDMKIKKVFIYKNQIVTKIDHIKNDKIGSMLSSSFVGLDQIFAPGIKAIFPLMGDVFNNKSYIRNELAIDDIDKNTVILDDNSFIDVNFEEMSFQVSKMDYFLIKNLFKFGNTPRIVMNYSELRKTPLLLTFFLHLPLAITSLMILVLILSFETGISKDVIYDEISKLPVQKYTSDLEFTECSICLESYQIGEDVRVLSCKHCFHKPCIDSWLGTMLRCPICRNAVTKLAESPSYELYQSLNYIP